MPGRLTDRSLARVSDAVRLAEGLARSALNRTAGGGLVGGDAQRPVWRCRCTGSPSSSTPGLYPGALLRLAYDPARPGADGGPAAWYEADRPPRPYWQRDAAGVIVEPRARDFGFFDPADPLCPPADVGPVWLLPATPGGSLAAGDEGVGVVVGEFEGRPILAFAGGGAGATVVRATAANSGTQWTPAAVVTYPAPPLSPPPPAPEVVDVQPLAHGRKLVVGRLYLAVDSGTRSPPPTGSPAGTAGPRRLHTDGDPAFTKTFTYGKCVSGVYTEITETISQP